MLQKAKKKTIKKNMSKREKKNVAVVMSLFNLEVSQNLLKGSLLAFKEMGFEHKLVKVFRVAGAFEIPFMIKKLALSKKYDGLIALGCVIRGETPHFEYISLAATMGCLTASLDALCPVSFGVITANNEKQALARSGLNGFNKGREAAFALFESLKQLENV